MRSPLWAPAVLAAVGLSACDKPAQLEITRTRVATIQPRPFKATATSRERFPSSFGPGHGAMGGSESSEKSAPFNWTTPKGWSFAGTTSMRLVNMKAGAAGAECYLTHLPGSAGGTLANVNRWRDQLGLAAIDGPALAKLPNRTVLGRTAVFIELEGGEETATRGVILPFALKGAAGTLFVKMVGSKNAVAAERAAFEAFCSSLAPASDHGGGDHSSHGHGAPKTQDDHDHSSHAGDPNAHADAKDGAGPPAPGPDLGWTVPAGWTEDSKPRAMREVTLVPAAGVECYVSLLRGMAGGLEANVNRWRKQVELEPLDAKGLEALETLKVLGRDARLVAAEGTYTGMDGTTKPATMLMGVVCELEGSTLFVKMVGPAAAVAAERERFRSFCASLVDKGAK